MGENVPVGVKIIAVLNYIGAVILLLAGIAILFGVGSLGRLEYSGAIPGIGTWVAGLGIVLAIILIALAVLCFFIGRGLWKGQNWARILEIVFSVIGLILAIIGMVQGNITSNIVSLVVSALIGGYLLFSKDVKLAFS